MVLRDGADFDPLSVLAHLQTAVPEFARPRYLVRADELLKTPSQRVRTAELRSRGIPDHAFDARSVAVAR